MHVSVHASMLQVPHKKQSSSLFSTHPTTAERVARLQRVLRDLSDLGGGSPKAGALKLARQERARLHKGGRAPVPVDPAVPRQ
jgi:hypothetical protein